MGFLYRRDTNDQNELRKREGGYKRIDCIVTLDSGEQVNAFTYVAKKECADRCGPPNKIM